MFDRSGAEVGDSALSVQDHTQCLRAQTQNFEDKMNCLDDERDELQLVLFMMARVQGGEAEQWPTLEHSGEVEILQTMADSDSLEDQVQKLEGDRHSMIARAQAWVAEIMDNSKANFERFGPQQQIFGRSGRIRYKV